MTDGFDHQPVMADEVVELLGDVPSGLVVDATVGGGGHARRLLEARPDLRLLGLDRDEAAVAAARRNLAGFGDRVEVLHARYERLGELAGGPASAPTRERGDASGDGSNSTAEREATSEPPRVSPPVVGVLFDLGVSSPQLDDPGRGFSYRHDGPLDMRMDTTQHQTAADLVNTATPDELERVIREYGEERFARVITRRIVERRPLHRTGELVDVITDAVPARARRTGPHPARRTFQALRIALNDELGRLRAGLDAALSVVVPDGRVLALSYHSLEDRIVKRRFADAGTGGVHPPGLPTRQTERGGAFRLLTRRPLRPGPDEVARNRRAESARLRAVERVVPETGEEAEDAA